jgi:surfactin synthase thioesterase subunit
MPDATSVGLWRTTRHLLQTGWRLIGNLERKWADHVEGEAVKGGHFFPEENPAETTDILTRFLSA